MDNRFNKVSIIVPIYNVEKYLAKCLSSLINQTYSNIEVIMVNDGSTDLSEEIAKTVVDTDDRFLLISQHNQGLSAARNAGLKIATGRYVYFLDSDDYLDTDHIEKLIKEFDEVTDIVIGKYHLEDSIIGRTYIPYESEKYGSVFFEGEEKEREIVERHLNAYPGKGYLIKDTLMPVWKNMYRKAFLEENNLTFTSERIVGAEDYVFNFEAYYYARRVKLSEANGVFHVIVSNSLSRTVNLDVGNRIDSRRKIMNELIAHKSFYNKDRILQAYSYEKIRDLIGYLDMICSSDICNKLDTVKLFFSKHEQGISFKKTQKPNLELKYLVIYYMISILGISFTCKVLRASKKFYTLYRKYEHVNRR